ncbi:uncharacterized protein LOC111342361 [Stylophora pistillata]|uniref:uncharacterized protein LOC111342361 n=1 Tax=Stylophora pistillata TaxID=50429 RepID=UPI000C03C558|nr:uncharacterized protein LOC111342361 [Stylophora pistillata]
MSGEECSPSKQRRLELRSALKVWSREDELFDMIINGARLERWLERSFQISDSQQEEAKAASCVKQIINQLPCNERYSSDNPVKVTILATQWKWFWWNSYFSNLVVELSKQLAKFPQVKVSFLVPEGSCDDVDKSDAKLHNVTIVEAKKRCEFNDCTEWLSYPPEGLTTDIVIGMGGTLNKMAQLFKERHHCKSIFLGGDAVYESLSKNVELRDALAESEEELDGGCNVQPIMEMADLPVAVGPKMADKLSASFSRQKKTVFEFTPGILHEYDDVTDTSCDRKKFRIMIAGHGSARHFDRESLDIVATAVAGLKDRSYEIILVGAAKGERKKFVKKLMECKVSKHQLIIRSPPKNEEELKGWLCEADLAIMPSSEQEFGMFGLAALSSGLPILVHGASGLGEALKPVIGGSLSIVESENDSEWSKAIKKVRDKDWKRRLEEADLLRKHYDEMYSWERQCGALVDEMLRIVSAQQGKTH